MIDRNEIARKSAAVFSCMLSTTERDYITIDGHKYFNFQTFKILIFLATEFLTIQFRAIIAGIPLS